MNKKPTSPRGATKQAVNQGFVCGSSNSSVTVQAPAKSAGALPAPPSPATWTRYADSRLKQFCCR